MNGPDDPIPLPQTQLQRARPVVRTGFGGPSAVVFDLNLILVRYFSPQEYPVLLGKALTGVRRVLRQADKLRVPPETVSERAALDQRQLESATDDN